jgi:hypothetical protein
VKEILALSPVSTVSANRNTQYSTNGLRSVILLVISVVEVFDIKSPPLPLSKTVYLRIIPFGNFGAAQLIMA